MLRDVYKEIFNNSISIKDSDIITEEINEEMREFNRDFRRKQFQSFLEASKILII